MWNLMGAQWVAADYIREAHRQAARHRLTAQALRTHPPRSPAWRTWLARIRRGASGGPARAAGDLTAAFTAGAAREPVLRPQPPP
jgi:hypothetical protein